MTLNAQINDALIEELTEIMNGEKDKHQAPKPNRKNNKKEGK